MVTEHTSGRVGGGGDSKAGHDVTMLSDVAHYNATIANLQQKR